MRFNLSILMNHESHSYLWFIENLSNIGDKFRKRFMTMRILSFRLDRFQ